MRIVSGEFKGRIFTPPKNFKARPTTDTAKESLFNILNNFYSFDEISVLDLFSGTGSISFEFASRGCQSINLVETNPVHFRFINKVIAELGLEKIGVYKANAFRFLEKTDKRYDVIFADPPYEMQGYERIPELVFGRKLLNQGGLLIMEHSKQNDLSGLIHFKEMRHYGSVHFSFFPADF